MEAYTKTSVSTNCGIAEKVRHVIMQWNFHQHADSLSGTQSGVQNLYDLIGNLSKCMHYIYVCTWPIGDQLFPVPAISMPTS